MEKKIIIGYFVYLCTIITIKTVIAINVIKHENKIIYHVNCLVSKQQTHQAIDLGLPSGTKWASCNVGANKPEEYGDYYAWGETTMKKEYTNDNYLYYKNGKSVNIGDDISGTQYDVAHVKWGGKWQMPTQKQIKELVDNCKCEWTTLHGVKGEKFTGPNGKSIFLPAAGYQHLMPTASCNAS